MSFSTNYGNLGETKFWRGAEAQFERPLDASANPYLTLALNVPAPAPGEFKPGNIFYAKVKVYGPQEHVAAGLDTDCGGSFALAIPERDLEDQGLGEGHDRR